MSKMAALIRAHDWAGSPLGPIKAWPGSLRTALDIILPSGFPTLLAWGPRFIPIYNDALIPLAGARHPSALGQPMEEAWTEIWAASGPLCRRARAGETITLRDLVMHVERDGQPQETWFTASLSPVRDDEGKAGGVMVVLAETASRALTNQAPREGSFPRPRQPPEAHPPSADGSAERDEAEHRLRTSEERLAAIFAQAAVGLSEVGGDGRFLAVNDALCRILGRSREDLLGLAVADVTHPDDVPPSIVALTRAAAGGEPASLDKRYLRPDGSRVWASSTVTRLQDRNGQPGNFLVVTADLTERRKAEEALRLSEERVRQFAEASTNVLWIRDAETLQWEFLSPAYEPIYGQSRAAALAGDTLHSWAALVHPEDRDEALGALDRVRAGEHVTLEYRIVRPSDGAVCWLRTTDFPIRDGEGRVVRIGGIGQDVTEAKATAARMEVLVAELQHRSRNILGLVQAMARQTRRDAASLDVFVERFDARLGALARANRLLSRLGAWDRITFDELLQTELQAHGALGSEDRRRQVTLDGPPGVQLRSAMVQTFALALHELATNAVKHGALSHPEGRLAVRWWLDTKADDEKWLHVHWSEHGMPNAVPDAGERRGSGRELIERALPYQLGAEVNYELGPERVECRIALSISSGDPGR
ncbi:PAS domain S-box protein [Sabulicella glaciei]|uniref:histidine kinase n=1 Tax=Sabulicella glaciei TaxID=2984948 RepID=A0ABT3NX43_9PROT|nr:PAS domain S-box protein [Roseococcus sp. MDT2-1-1]MCW8086139.1 PAS domain S-box protein [Roseococcus sp. MDT2-1-1]